MPLLSRGAFVCSEHAGEGIDQLTGFDLGEIAELSEVDAEQWHRRAVEGTDGAQHRAVSAEAHDDLGVGQRPFVGVVRQVELGAVVGHQPTVVAAGGEPGHRLLDEGDDIGPFVMGDDRHLRHRRVPVVAWTRNSRLPSPPWIGDSIQPCTRHPARTRVSSIS